MGRTLDDKRRKKSERTSIKKKQSIDDSIEQQIADYTNTILNCERDLKTSIFQGNHAIQRKLDFAKLTLEDLKEKLIRQREQRLKEFILYFDELSKQNLKWGISDLRRKSKQLEIEIPEQYLK